ncbi:RHS repeat-associated core domain-containing protein [Pseudomonas sp. LAIL14HWK12:I7]|uniref:RHS repeat-associated core domain-containing protein n=1 Tax=Pseudomonas sp. LAIL14HWK12:I7 TaxID=1259801 RepID=UPI00067F6F88|nr:RHS repeat-associated core domain-containing protein [Pseudomonas sp. LAIL14HWK12:I7]
MKRTTIVASDDSQSPVGFTEGGKFLQIAFTPYGWSKAHPLTVGFKGEHLEPVAHRFVLGGGHRMYDPALMRFNSPDQESPFKKGGLNAYAFVMDDPINGSDPTGRFVEFFRSFFNRLTTSKTYQGEFVAAFDGIVAFTGAERRDGNLSTLYLVAHGTEGLISGDNKNMYNAQRVYDYLSIQKGVNMRHRQTHIFACDTSLTNPTTGTSFISDLSSLTGAQSSGYDATVSVSHWRDGDTVTALKHRVLPYHGMTSVKTRAGVLRNPHKLNPRNAEADFYNA